MCRIALGSGYGGYSPDGLLWAWLAGVCLVKRGLPLKLLVSLDPRICFIQEFLDSINRKVDIMVPSQRRTYLAVDEAGPRPRERTSAAGVPHEAGLVLVGIATDGGSVTYWKGSGGLVCIAGRPTLGSIYADAGEGSLLTKGEALVQKRIRTTIIPHWRQASLVYLEQAVLHWRRSLPCSLGSETRSTGETYRQVSMLDSVCHL